MNVEMRFTKWGGRRHWTYLLEPLGEDEHGQWFGARAGTVMRRGEEPPIVQPHDFLTLVPVTGNWIASFNPAGADTDVSVYIDVTSRPWIDGAAIHAVDLDLDVIRLWDGEVRVLDEDEFAEHQLLYGYPPEVTAQAQATTDELVALMSAGEQPFETAARARLAGY
ncbi:DUF402 domain-containing protein [Actinoplanes couchii]|uniref:DUF402 domain-containing protein n=1 Tax=Actinoplanes couchii TaxID=403638 RepID=UPI001942DB0C|nr:DUF402 domain-containing protein [Actinoplanes couchii]